MRRPAPVVPLSTLQTLSQARRGRGWSQSELGRQVGLPQMHISEIETGRVTPRYDTLLELVRVLGYDLVLVPRPLVPVVQALVHNHQRSTDAQNLQGSQPDERPLYVPDEVE